MKIEQVKKLVSKFVGVKIREIDSYSEKLDNYLYIVNDSYIVRAEPFLADPSVNYLSEQIMIDALKDTNLTENVLYFNKKNGIKIYRYIKTTPQYNRINSLTVSTFIKALQKIHSLDIKGLEIFDFLRNIMIYKEQINKKYYIDDKIEQRILSDLTKYKTNLENVPSSNNLFKDKVKFLKSDLRILDFRYAALNSPIYDLAFFSNSCDFNQNEDDFLLKKYFGYKNKIKYKHILQFYKNYINLLLYYRYTYLYVKSGETVYLNLKDYYLKRIQ